MNGKKLYLLLCVGLAVCVSNGALINDDFESYTDGSVLNGSGGWTVTYADGTQPVSGTQVVTVSSDKASPFGTGSQSMYYYDASTSTSPMWAGQSFSAVSHAVTISFDFVMTYNMFQNPVFKLSSDAGANGILLNLQSTSYNAGGVGMMRYRDNSGAWQNVGSVTNQNWYNVKITISDFSTDTYDLVLTEAGGTVVANLTGLSMYASMGNIAEVGFGISNAAQAKSTTFYVDNLTVIPEPASVSLFVVASASLLAMRHAIVK
ncbi:MAG: hypothetical protein AB7E95_07855 [Kiritimatiellales bacterium]